ncbi:hypothetical protein PLESTB_000200700 [Pleodorina starrii]|uniref:PLAC8 family protein n=1 Tax=Pleodorina starrii TaxID=330485 RepID=A0A9W6BCL5_9CHLO|nr:hypothetical protein PLESTB_000200700 [Pleodorina starrii]GLC73478.1 hypothetical protein PLESTF_001382200 [Pleodorina starrii]
MGVAEEQKAAERKPLVEKGGPVAAPLGVEELDGNWSTGLCDCCAQPGGGALGLVALCMPFVQYGVLAEQLPEGSTWVANSFRNAACGFLCLDVAASLAHCSVWPGVSLLPTSALLHVEMRRHLRSKYGIKGSWLNDLCTSWWCGPCALAQETREMVIRARQQQQQQGVGAAQQQLQQPGMQLFGHMFMAPPGQMASGSAAPAHAPTAPTAITYAPQQGMQMVADAAAPATGVPVPYAAVPPTHFATITLPAPNKDARAPALAN